MFNQRSGGKVNNTWILLDGYLMVNIFSNHRFQQNIRPVNKEPHFYTNKRKSFINRVGDLPGFGTVWYHHKGIANVLSLHTVSRKKDYKVQYQNWIKHKFKVINPVRVQRRLAPSNRGLYYCDRSSEMSTNEILLLNTISDNKCQFLVIYVNRAEIAQ